MRQEKQCKECGDIIESNTSRPFENVCIGCQIMHTRTNKMEHSNMTSEEKAISKIEADGIEEIIRIAVSCHCDNFNGIVFYDPDDNTFSGETWTSGTYLNPESRLVEVFRLGGNWIGNNSWKVNDILTDEEYEELKKAVAENENLTDEDEIEYAADFLDEDKLELISICLKDRFIEYLECDDTLKGRIIEGLEEY